MFFCKVKQECSRAIVPKGILKISNQEIPADNGFCFCRKIGYDVHLFFIFQIITFFVNADGSIIFLTERGQQEEIHHPIFISTKFCFRCINFLYHPFYIIYCVLSGDFLVTLVFLFQFRYLCGYCLCNLITFSYLGCGLFHITECDVSLPNLGIKCNLSGFALPADFIAYLHIVCLFFLVIL